MRRGERGGLGWFGLAAGADERDLKRAYAQRLKTVRPDEDPEGFQQLRARYEAALEWIRARGDAGDDDAPLPVVTVRMPQPAWQPSIRVPVVPVVRVAASEPAEAPLDLQAFYEDFIARVAMDDERRLREWLDAHPALWSLDRKLPVGRWLVERLIDDIPVMRNALFDDTLQFFGLSQVQRNVDVAPLIRLRRRMHLRYVLSNRRELYRLVRGNDGRPSEKVADAILRQLSRPLHPVRAMLFGLLQGPARVRDFLLRLDGGRLDLPAPIQPAQVKFFLSAADTTALGWPRVAIGSVWAFAFVWFITLVVSMARHDTQWLHGTLVDLAWSPVWVAGMYGSWLVLTVPVRRLFDWHAAPEATPMRWPWLRLCLVPLLVSATLVAWAATDNIAWLFAGGPAALALSTHRYMRRAGHAVTVGVPHVLLGLLLCSFGPLALLVATVLWLIDTFRHRKVLQFRNA